MVAASSSCAITVEDLTPRQAEVAELMARGLSYKRVAKELAISPRTVQEHVYAVAEALPGNAAPSKRVAIWFATTPRSA